MNTEYFVEQYTEEDASQDTNVFGCMPATGIKIPVGVFVLKRYDLYHDEDGDLTEAEHWLPELGIFLREEDAEKRLKDLRIAEASEEIHNLLQKTAVPKRRAF